ncbi:helix-turn-helix domain-containing protein [Tepidamorphus sp. 3E244]|uniref:helix-turn-helix domain-containing protein n=1 Tax=Tepidamorphus sp. 3E244 TaxID=3385498 RepID=UPI0038FCC413
MYQGISNEEPAFSWNAAPLAGAVPLRQSSVRQDALQVALLVAEVTGTDVCSLYAARRGQAHVSLARQMAMYLTHVVHGHALTSVGEAYGRDRTTVAHACMIVEERRDEAEFDRTISRLENLVEKGGVR